MKSNKTTSKTEMDLTATERCSIQTWRIPDYKSSGIECKWQKWFFEVINEFLTAFSCIFWTVRERESSALWRRVGLQVGSGSGRDCRQWSCPLKNRCGCGCSGWSRGRGPVARTRTAWSARHRSPAECRVCWPLRHSHWGCHFWGRGRAGVWLVGPIEWLRCEPLRTRAATRTASSSRAYDLWIQKYTDLKSRSDFIVIC